MTLSDPTPDLNLPRHLTDVKGKASVVWRPGIVIYRRLRVP